MHLQKENGKRNKKINVESFQIKNFNFKFFIIFKFFKWIFKLEIVFKLKRKCLWKENTDGSVLPYLKSIIRFFDTYF